MCVHVFIQEYISHKDILINVCYICALVIIKPRANILCLYVYMCVVTIQAHQLKKLGNVDETEMRP